MKNKLFILALSIGALCSFSSCEDFLDETADKSGNAYIYHMDQLYGLTGQASFYLGGDSEVGASGSTGGFMQEQYLMGDGLDISPDFYSKGMPMYFVMMPYAYPLYCWDGYSLKNDNIVSSMTWKKAYDRIYTCNTVLENMDKVIQTTPAIRAQVEGEARFGRAFYHFLLLTQYCLWQDDAPGIGYREDTNPNKVPERETVGYTLSRIYEDLDLAEKALTQAGRTAVDADINIRPTVPVVHALWARIALYRGDYETALTHAEKALEGNDALENVFNDPDFELTPMMEVKYLNQDGTVDEARTKWMKVPTALYNQYVVASPEIYLPCMSSDASTLALPISESFYDLFTDKEHDARWTSYYDSGYTYMMASGVSVEIQNGGITWATQQWLKPWMFNTYWHYMGQNGPSCIVGMTTPEMYLTKAECLARAGRTDEAAEVLRTLRRTRFTDETAANNIGGSVEEVLDERSREMGPFWRFYEAKRLNGAEHAGIELRREILANTADPASVTEIVIPADDPRWALPFYATECELMGWEQNEGWE